MEGTKRFILRDVLERERVNDPQWKVNFLLLARDELSVKVAN